MVSFVSGFITGYGLVMMWKGTAREKGMGPYVAGFGALVLLVSMF